MPEWKNAPKITASYTGPLTYIMYKLSYIWVFKVCCLFLLFLFWSWLGLETSSLIYRKLKFNCIMLLSKAYDVMMSNVFFRVSGVHRQYIFQKSNFMEKTVSDVGLSNVSCDICSFLNWLWKSMNWFYTARI